MISVGVDWREIADRFSLEINLAWLSLALDQSEALELMLVSDRTSGLRR